MVLDSLDLILDISPQSCYFSYAQSPLLRQVLLIFQKLAMMLLLLILFGYLTSSTHLFISSISVEDSPLFTLYPSGYFTHRQSFERLYTIFLYSQKEMSLFNFEEH